MDELRSFESYEAIASFSLADVDADMLVRCIEHLDRAKREEQHNDEDDGSTRILLRHRDFLIEINPTFFEVKLKQLIETGFSMVSDYDSSEHIVKYNKFHEICHRSKAAFQHFVRHTARFQIKHGYPGAVQAYLEQFLFDMKLKRISRQSFFQLYEDELLNYVMILDGVDGDDDNVPEMISGLLRNLRKRNFENFVIVVTHFNRYLYLLKAT